MRGANPLETLLAVAERIPARFEYRSGATFVGSTVEDLLEGGAGVCQDFVHLGALLLRRLGIGARYVSGYLFAAPPGGGEDSVEVQTHAWLEGLLPERDGERRWIGVDPTNRGRAGETHVKIGHGRDYQDVAPIRGVYQGRGDGRAQRRGRDAPARRDAGVGGAPTRPGRGPALSSSMLNAPSIRVETVPSELITNSHGSVRRL